jgi:hypothetical protein
VQTAYGSQSMRGAPHNSDQVSLLPNATSPHEPPCVRADCLQQADEEVCVGVCWTQWEIYSTRTYRHALLNRADVEANTERQITLTYVWPGREGTSAQSP